MNLPTKGSFVAVDGYGTAVFVGGIDLDTDDGAVLLKFEGSYNATDLSEGYGTGIIEVPYDEFTENRVYTEQLPSGTAVSDVVSTEKRDEIFDERFDE